MTRIGLDGEQFLIDGRPSYASRKFDGHPVEGLLFNVRAVQATFDDANPYTEACWAYPDTGEWNADRNTNDFISSLASWKAHGVLGFTAGFQGGGARYIPEIYDSYENNAFTSVGELKPAYADRMGRLLRAANELGMVAMVSFFYWKQTEKMAGEEAVWRAVENGLAFLKDTGYPNILIEIANETDILFNLPIFSPSNAHHMITFFKGRYPQFHYSTSLCVFDPQDGLGVPPESLVEACDYLLIHGNWKSADTLERYIDAVRAVPAFRRAPKPVMINEDSTGLPNLEAAWRRGVSWGYYDQGHNGEERVHDFYTQDEGGIPRESTYADLSGFQTPPVNWGINTVRKQAFFDRVAQITGLKS